MRFVVGAGVVAVGIALGCGGDELPDAPSEEIGAGEPAVQPAKRQKGERRDRGAASEVELAEYYIQQGSPVVHAISVSKDGKGVLWGQHRAEGTVSYYFLPLSGVQVRGDKIRFQIQQSVDFYESPMFPNEQPTSSSRGFGNLDLRFEGTVSGDTLTLSCQGRDCDFTTEKYSAYFLGG